MIKHLNEFKPGHLYKMSNVKMLVFVRKDIEPQKLFFFSENGEPWRIIGNVWNIETGHLKQSAQRLSIAHETYPNQAEKMMEKGLRLQKINSVKNMK